jgi:signal transduction histidine kinase/CheY-like chemotaxis protein
MFTGSPGHEEMTRPGWLSALRRTYLAEGLLYGFVLISMILMLTLAEREKVASYNAALVTYRSEAGLRSREAANQIRAKFRQIYSGIRTLARLPGIRTIDRHAKNFDENARSSAQEIYNNLAESVAVSEVYIVPADFDPDAIDPVTDKPQEPIAEFDELIVGRTAESTALRPSGVAPPAAPEPKSDKIEIHEYRLMKEQLALLKARFPDESKIDRLFYPAIAGHEVVTCDNTHYSPSHPNDKDRSGIVYSVPFYGTDGSFRGMVSAVALTAAIRNMLPGEDFVLLNQPYRYVAAAQPDTPNPLEHREAAPDPLYSEAINLDIADLTGGWMLWSGLDDKHYWSGAGVVRAGIKAVSQEVLIGVCALFLCLMIYSFNARHRAAQARSSELEARIIERTKDLARATEAANVASRAKSQFLSVTSHEIRTPINSILGMADMLAHAALPEPQTRRVRIIQSAADTLLNIVNDILDISKIEAGKIELHPAPCAIAAIVADAVGLFAGQAAAKSLVLVTEIDPGLPATILADGGRLRQVLINLIGNAVKFTQKGEIRVGAHAEPDLAAPDGMVELSFTVRDTGIGIDPAAAASVFDAFYQGSEQNAKHLGGTGLGLAISRTLVELMGGQLGFESTPGAGTKFCFSILTQPLDAATPDGYRPQPRGPNAEGQANSLRNAAILLVEDNPVSQEVTRAYLERLGCEVAVAENGAEAIDAARTRRFDAILMDCQMPDVDGFEATELIRRSEAERACAPVPIVALTASAFVHDRARCLSAGMSDHLSKPFTAHSLQQMLVKHIAEMRATAVS